MLATSRHEDSPVGLRFEQPDGAIVFEPVRLDLSHGWTGSARQVAWTPTRQPTCVYELATHEDEDRIAGDPWRVVVSKRVAELQWAERDPIGRQKGLQCFPNHLRGRCAHCAKIFGHFNRVVLVQILCPLTNIGT